MFLCVRALLKPGESESPAEASISWFHAPGDMEKDAPKNMYDRKDTAGFL